MTVEQALWHGRGQWWRWHLDRSKGGTDSVCRRQKRRKGIRRIECAPVDAIRRSLDRAARLQCLVGRAIESHLVCRKGILGRKDRVTRKGRRQLELIRRDEPPIDRGTKVLNRSECAVCLSGPRVVFTRCTDDESIALGKDKSKSRDLLQLLDL